MTTGQVMAMAPIISLLESVEFKNGERQNLVGVTVLG
jgi:hypothetical protein